MGQKYLEEALKWIGVKEVPGKGKDKANPAILEFHKHTTLKATEDEVPWCSSFANFVVDTCGDKGTGSAAARSWLDWGKVIDAPVPGCIVVFSRKTKDNPMSAHVAFFVCGDEDGQSIQVIGGNQGDSVKQSKYPRNTVLGYRDK